MMNCTYNRNLECWEGRDADELRYQIARIGGLKGYPREVVAVRELIRVLALCDDVQHVHRVIDDLSESAPECPSPARLRALIFEKRTKAKRNSCLLCSGEGYRSVPLLVTYKGGSYQVESQMPMPDVSWEDADLMAAKLPAHQTILGAAVPCVCFKQFTKAEAA